MTSGPTYPSCTGPSRDRVRVDGPARARRATARPAVPAGPTYGRLPPVPGSWRPPCKDQDQLGRGRRPAARSRACSPRARSSSAQLERSISESSSVPYFSNSSPLAEQHLGVDLRPCAADTCTAARPVPGQPRVNCGPVCACTWGPGGGLGGGRGPETEFISDPSPGPARRAHHVYIRMGCSYALQRISYGRMRPKSDLGCHTISYGPYGAGEGGRGPGGGGVGTAHRYRRSRRRQRIYISAE